MSRRSVRVVFRCASTRRSTRAGARLAAPPPTPRDDDEETIADILLPHRRGARGVGIARAIVADRVLTVPFVPTLELPGRSRASRPRAVANCPIPATAGTSPGLATSRPNVDEQPANSGLGFVAAQSLASGGRLAVVTDPLAENRLSLEQYFWRAARGAAATRLAPTPARRAGRSASTPFNAARPADRAGRSRRAADPRSRAASFASPFASTSGAGAGRRARGVDAIADAAQEAAR